MGAEGGLGEGSPRRHQMPIRLPTITIGATPLTLAALALAEVRTQLVHVNVGASDEALQTVFHRVARPISSLLERG